MAILSIERITNGASKLRYGSQIHVPFWGCTPRSNCDVFFSNLREGLGDVYPSYTNGEKERYVCRASRVDGIHDGFDKKQQCVKMADVFGVEKIWSGEYEACRKHGDFTSLRSTLPARIIKVIAFILRNEKLPEAVVGEAQ